MTGKRLQKKKQIDTRPTHKQIRRFHRHLCSFLSLLFDSFTCITKHQEKNQTKNNNANNYKNTEKKA